MSTNTHAGRTVDAKQIIHVLRRSCSVMVRGKDRQEQAGA